MKDVRITHIGGPTVLIETQGWRLLTDPTFDPPGKRYVFGWGTSSRKLEGPSIPASELAPIDAVLLSHDHHDDNLDGVGRALLPSVGAVVTTVSGAERLGGNARGLAPWATTRLEAPGRPAIEVTATPCRHGPPLSHPIRVVERDVLEAEIGVAQPVHVAHRPVEDGERGEAEEVELHQARLLDVVLVELAHHRAGALGAIERREVGELARAR